MRTRWHHARRYPGRCIREGGTPARRLRVPGLRGCSLTSSVARKSASTARSARRSVEQRIGFDEVVSLLGLGALLRRGARISFPAVSGSASRSAARCSPSLACCCSMSHWHHSTPHVAEKMLPYLEALRDRLSIPMIFVSHQFSLVLRLATPVVVLDRRAGRSSGIDRAKSASPPALRAIVGPDAVGAVIDGVVTADRRRSQAGRAPALAGGTLRISSRDLLSDGCTQSGSQTCARSAARARHHPGNRTAARA